MAKKKKVERDVTESQTANLSPAEELKNAKLALKKITNKYKQVGIDIAPAAKFKAYQGKLERISTGSLSLDMAMGGGFVVGNNEIHGGPGVGKTTMCIHTAINAILAGFIVIYVDRDGTLQLDYVYRAYKWYTGQDMPDDMFQLFNSSDSHVVEDIIIDLAKAKVKFCLIVDPLSTLVPKETVDKSAAIAEMGKQQKDLARLLNTILSVTAIQKVDEKRKFCFIWVAEEYADMKPMAKLPVTKGGNKPKYVKQIEVWVKRYQGNLPEPFKKINLPYGIYTDSGVPASQTSTSPYYIKRANAAGRAVAAHVKKNKGFPEEKTCIFDFYYADTSLPGVQKGSIDIVREIVITGVRYKYIQRKGSTYYLPFINLETGKQEVISALGIEQFEDTLRKQMAAHILAKSSGSTSPTVIESIRHTFIEMFIHMNGRNASAIELQDGYKTLGLTVDLSGSEEVEDTIASIEFVGTEEEVADV